MVSGMYTRRDVEWKTPFSGERLVRPLAFPLFSSPFPAPFLHLDLFFLQAKVKGKEKDDADQSFQFSHIFSHNQLALILDVLGTPTIDEFHAITSKRSKDYIRSLP